MNSQPIQKTKQPHRNIVGEPINFRGLLHAPVNEQGVVLLFGMLAEQLGFRVQLVRQGYPDCKAARDIGNGRYEEVNIEFEFRSSGFKSHLREEVKTDIIVCWVHDWKNCPSSIQVLELHPLIQSGQLNAPPPAKPQQRQPHREIIRSPDEQRIYDLLNAIALDEGKVVCRIGGDSYIQTPFEAVERVCLFADDEKESSLTLGLYFGDTQNQAKAFYNSSPNISHLEDNQWRICPNFHVAFRAKGLIWFPSDDADHYLQFWGQNIHKIRQQKKGEIPAFLKWLTDNNVIKTTKETEKMLKERFYDTKMSRLNICPGFLLEFKVAKMDELDDAGQLKAILVKRINEALKVLTLDGRKVLKRF